MNLNDKAPDFLLSAANGEEVHLEDLQGSFVILVFYPMNHTPVCTSQLKGFNESLSELQSANTLILGINPASPESHQGFCSRQKLDFMLLSDPGAKVARQYKATYGVFPFNRRTVVVVDPHGEVCFYQPGNPSPQTVLAAIRQRTQALGK